MNETRKIAYGPGCLQALCDLAYSRYPDDCRREDNCDGQQFSDKYPGDAHEHVAEELDENTEFWSLEYLGDAMGERLRAAFISAASRMDEAALALLAKDYLTPTEAAALLERWKSPDAFEEALHDHGLGIATRLQRSQNDALLAMQATIEKVAAKESTRTNPGVKGHEYDDLRVIRRA